MIVLEELGSGQFVPFENLADVTQLINQHLSAMVSRFSSFKRARPSGWSSFYTSVHAEALHRYQGSLGPARKLKYLVAEVEEYTVESELLM